MECRPYSEGHAIIGGFGHLGSRIAEQLRERGYSVTVIDTDADDLTRKRVEAAGCDFTKGDIRDDFVLQEAGIDSASCFITVTGDDRANLEAALSARQMNSKVPVILRLFDQSLAKRIESAVDVHALSASFLASPAYVSAATDQSVASLFNIDGCYLCLTCGCESRNGSLRIAKDGQDLRVASQEEQAKDDCLAAWVQQESHPPLHRSHKKKARTPWMRVKHTLSYLHPVRLYQEILNIWSHAALVSRYLFVSLLVVALFSILVFSSAGKMNPLDAVYFVVVTMTTTGYGDFNLQNAPVGLKIYGIIMMLAGAALMATIYAIIADYVLTARVEYLLGRREVNLRNHTVVVGLGNVGYRVAHDLRMLGVDVVAIEANEDSDNVSAARPLFPVIVGDASRPSILQKAGVERASVILAVTDDSMLNLSVALQARESNPRIKTVVRTYELGLADKLKNFGLDDVISTSAIAAPAFVDAALYSGVQGSFRCGDGDVLVAKHTVTNTSPLCGKSVAEISEELGIAVVLAAGSGRSSYALTSPDKRIASGDRVVVLLDREKVRMLEIS